MSHTQNVIGYVKIRPNNISERQDNVLTFQSKGGWGSLSTGKK